MVVESDPVWGITGAAEQLANVFAHAPNRKLMLRRLAAAGTSRSILGKTSIRNNRPIQYEGLSNYSQ